MAGHEVFEKRYVDASQLSDVEGLLEHFNLPPKVITFLRENKRIIQVLLALVILVVVSWSLYGSYRDKQIEQGANALTLAMKEPQTLQQAALKLVAQQYGSTTSATWAKVQLAHLEMEKKNYEAAASQYAEIQKTIDEEDPLYPLVVYGQAQAYEGQKSFDKARIAYGELKEIEGYQLLGYTGIARIHESQGDIDSALGIYGQYLAVLGEEADETIKSVLDERIAMLKTRQ